MRSTQPYLSPIHTRFGRTTEELCVFLKDRCHLSTWWSSWLSPSTPNPLATLPFARSKHGPSTCCGAGIEPGLRWSQVYHLSCICQRLSVSHTSTPGNGGGGAFENSTLERKMAGFWGDDMEDLGVFYCYSQCWVHHLQGKWKWCSSWLWVMRIKCQGTCSYKWNYIFVGLKKYNSGTIGLGILFS